MEDGIDEETARAILKAAARLRMTVRSAADSGLSSDEIAALAGLAPEDVDALLADE